MKATIRVTLSELASKELLELMQILNVSNPTHAINTVVTEYYQHCLSLREEKLNDHTSTSKPQ